MKKLTLVLGGGAAKGYAHIGVIKILEENGIKPDLIIGTSMGAVVGCAYASGKNADDLIKLSKTLNSKQFIDFNIFHAIFHNSILQGKRLKKVLIKEIGDISHNELKIPFIAIATNLLEGEIEILSEGRVVDNVLASSAIPGVYPAIKQDDKLLCDGGILDNVPDDIAKKWCKNNVILSVDVIGDFNRQIETSKFKIMSLTINALTLMQTKITKYKGNNSDLRIKITQPDVPQMNFTKENAEKSIDYGKKAMKRNLAKLKKMLED